MPGPADALDSGGNGLRRIKLTNEVNRADVDPELERRSRDDCFQFAALQALFGEQALGAREAAMMRHHRVGAESFLQIQRDALGGTAAQREDQGRAMLSDEPRDFVVHRIPMLMRRERTQVRTGCEDFEVHGANSIVSANNFHRTRTRGIAINVVSGQKLRELLDWIQRRGEADSIGPRLSPAGDEALETFQRQGQMRTALVAGERVQFIDDNVTNGSELLAELRRGQQDEQRL